MAIILHHQPERRGWGQKLGYLITVHLNFHSHCSRGKDDDDVVGFIEGISVAQNLFNLKVPLKEAKTRNSAWSKPGPFG